MKNKIVNFSKMAVALFAILGAAAGCAPTTNPNDPSTPSVEPSLEPSVEPSTEPEKEYWNETYRNPLIPRGSNGQKYMDEAPDPSIVRGDDGYWYAVTTGNGGGKMFRSENCCTWKLHLDRVIPRPTWGDHKGGDTPNVWAPDLIKIQDKWIYYYSLSGWGNAIGIGYAVADAVEGPYTDMGKLITCEELGLENAIDPCIYIEDDAIYMAIGSFQGIDMIELEADGMSVKGDPKATKVLIAGSYGGWNGAETEGSYIIKKDDYYYYFGSMGTCCVGADSTYKVVVARSKSITGPYVDDQRRTMVGDGGAGKVVCWASAGNGKYYGPGHNSVFQDDAGDYWLFYHAFTKDDSFARRHMMMDKLYWDEDGWPYIVGEGKFKPSYMEEMDGPRFFDE